jgi:hypothetical protein
MVAAEVGALATRALARARAMGPERIRKVAAPGAVEAAAAAAAAVEVCDI